MARGAIGSSEGHQRKLENDEQRCISLKINDRSDFDKGDLLRAWESQNINLRQEAGTP